MSKYTLILLMLLLAAWLRFDGLTQDRRFHPDEALFATFARNAAVYGDWMLSGALDKPPLSLYASALSVQFTGVHINAAGVLDLAPKVGEFSARLPSVFAGVVLVALVYRLACVVTSSRRAGLAAALLVALSPLAMLYHSTAFTDALMLTLMVAALAAAVEGKAGWSGLLLGLSITAKQQGVLYAPLVVWVVFTTVYCYNLTPCKHLPFWRFSPPPLQMERGTGGVRFVISFLFPLLILLLWDSARPEASIFTLASANNAPEEFFAPPETWLPRLRVWLDVLGSFWGHGLISAGVFVLAVWGVVSSLRWRGGYIMPLRAPSPLSPGGRGENRAGIRGEGLMLFTLLYLLAHTVIDLNQYDRYMLPILPLVAVLAGRGFAQLTQRLKPRQVATVGTVFVILMLAVQPTMEDNRRRDDAIIALAGWLNTKPVATIIYDHWLGWDLGYYMGPWSDKRRVYFPTPQTMAQAASENPELTPRYIIFPDFGTDSRLWDAAVPQTPPPDAWLDALRGAGFTVSDTPVYDSGGFTVFELTLLN